MAIVAAFNQKGGVSKTTTVLNLAAALTHRGNQPVGIDLDTQAQFSSISGLTSNSADNSIFSLFQRNRPLPDLICESPSGIWRKSF
jgi:chromosome partitioning protein